MKPTFKQTLLPLAAVIPCLLASCQDLDYGYTAESIKYAKAYEDAFGEISPDQDWDLSSYKNHYDPDKNSGTRANTATSDGTLDDGTYASGAEYETKDTWWQVPQSTYDWMKKALVEGKDNRYLGSNFVLQLPENDFAIVPIFQGKSSIMSELEVKINGYNIKTVWSRSQNIQVKDADRQIGADGDGWMNIGYFDGYSTYTDAAQMKNEYEAQKADGVTFPKYPSYTDEADAVRAKPIYFRSKDKIAVTDKGFMYLSLHNIDKAYSWWTNFTKKWDEDNMWTTAGHRLTSINPNGHMLALNIPWDQRPKSTELPDICEYNDLKTGKGKQQPSQVLIIACEDANGPDSDHDVNDVAFMIIGYPNVPTVVPTTEVIKKRYMCEDLGGAYDYDFNDIVVDVTQTQKYRIDAVPDELESYTNPGNIVIKDMVKVGCPVQTAKIARLCGTIPIQVMVGDYLFPKINNPASPTGEYSSRCELNDNAKNFCDGQHASGCTCSSHASYHTNGQEVTPVYPTRADGNTEITTKGWNPNEEHVIPCHTWNPDKNNIVIFADWTTYKDWYTEGELENITKNYSHVFESNSTDFADFANGRKFPVTFPKNGSYPYIIATDQDVPWMREGIHIPDAWIKGDLSVHSASTNDEIGNCFYMENYPQTDAEGVIWRGNVNGLAYSTGVTILPGTAEHEAIKDAVDGHLYHVLHVYTEEQSGESTKIGVYTASGAREWLPICETDADGYLPTTRVHDTRNSDAQGLVCTTVYLTWEQLNAIKENGLVVASRSNGVAIKKITMSRACKYKNAEGAYQYDGTEVENEIDPGYKVAIELGDANGTIIASSNERAAALQKYPDGATESEKAAVDAANATEIARAAIPFKSAHFLTGTEITLTAIGKPGYKLDKWTLNGTEWTASSSASGNKNLMTIKHTTYGDGTDATKAPTYTVKAWFKSAANPNIGFTSDRSQQSITVTLDVNGGAYAIPVYSDNLSSDCLIGTFGHNTKTIDVATSLNGTTNHVLTVTPKAVGETSFILYQPDGDYNSKSYGVSGELNVTVKVVEKPAKGVDVTAGMCYLWDKVADDAAVAGAGADVAYNVGSGVSNPEGYGTIYGNMGNGLDYVDLNHSDYLVITTAAGSGVPVVWFNKGGTDAEKYTYGLSADDGSYSTVINNADGTTSYVMNLKKVRDVKGYSILNAITTKWKSSETYTVTDIYVDKYSSAAAAAWETNQNTYNAVGIVYQVAPYPEEGASPAYTKTLPGGKVTFSTAETFYRKNGSSYEAMTAKTIEMGVDELIYVHPNTNVTMTLPNNANNYKLIEANSFENGVRTAKIDHDPYTPWIKYYEKKDPNLVLSSNEITLNGTGGSITYTSNSDYESKNSYRRYVSIAGSFDFEKDFNVWNSEKGSIPFQIRTRNCDKVLTISQPATDVYKYAEATLTVHARVYPQIATGGYEVPCSLEGTVAGKYGDTQLYDHTVDCEAIKNALGGSIPNKVKIFVQRNDYSFTQWIVKSSDDSVICLPMWTETATDGDTFSWTDPSSHMGFWCTVTKDFWQEHLEGKQLIIESNKQQHSTSGSKLYTISVVAL